MGSGTFDPASYVAYARSTVGKTTDKIYGSRSLDPDLNPRAVETGGDPLRSM